MTYTESEQYRKEHINIVGKPSLLKRIPYYINYLLIAPKDKSIKDRLAVLNESRYKIIDNAIALKNLGFYTSNLDVYVIWEIDNNPHEMLLHDYLTEINPK
jgi:hypothetical protein